ncbi:MAG: response regulator [Proteobacteria bacterium]|nr:response regulator [Pseudomonadota bacterium]
MNQKTVLIIEDEENLAGIMRDYLLQVNVTCFIINDGGVAINAVKNYKPDVILLDLLLPNKDGIQICKEVYHGN